jgi:hypothetical protein
MRVLYSVIALLALAGCMSAEEQRMIAMAKTKCAEQIAKADWHGPLTWTAKKSSNGLWNVTGSLDPLGRVGVVIDPQQRCRPFRTSIEVPW